MPKEFCQTVMALIVIFAFVLLFVELRRMKNDAGGALKVQPVKTMMPLPTIPMEVK